MTPQDAFIESLNRLMPIVNVSLFALLIWRYKKVDKLLDECAHELDRLKNLSVTFAKERRKE